MDPSVISWSQFLNETKVYVKIYEIRVHNFPVVHIVKSLQLKVGLAGIG